MVNFKGLKNLKCIVEENEQGEMNTNSTPQPQSLNSMLMFVEYKYSLSQGFSTVYLHWFTHSLPSEQSRHKSLCTNTKFIERTKLLESGEN